MDTSKTEGEKKRKENQHTTSTCIKEDYMNYLSHLKCSIWMYSCRSFLKNIWQW